MAESFLLALAVIAALAFFLDFRSEEFDWKPVFVVLAGNLVALAAALIVDFVWPSRQFLLTGNPSLFFTRDTTVVLLLASVLAVVSFLELLLIRCVAVSVKFMKQFVADCRQTTC